VAQLVHRERRSGPHLNDLADVEQRSGDFAAAERDYREGLRVARAVGYAEGVATFMGNLASLAWSRDDWPKVEALAREALPLSEKVGRHELIASDCLSLAEALAGRGRSWREALRPARGGNLHQARLAPSRSRPRNSREVRSLTRQGDLNRNVRMSTPWSFCSRQARYCSA